jgi:hypothetical protein
MDLILSVSDLVIAYTLGDTIQRAGTFYPLLGIMPNLMLAAAAMNFSYVRCLLATRCDCAPLAVDELVDDQDW